jgi:hypothetical protein
MVVCALCFACGTTGSAGAAGLARLKCEVLHGSEREIGWLLRRQEELLHLYQAEERIDVARRFADPADRERNDLAAWKLEMDRLWRTTRLLEWRVLGVHQCGPIAVAFVRLWWQHADTGPYETEGPVWWVWKEGEWYVTDSAEGYLLADSGGVGIGWSLRDQVVWIGKPRAEFVPVWRSGESTDKDSVPRTVERYRAEIEGYNKDPIGYLMSRSDSSRVRRGALRGVIELYADALLRDDENEVAGFYEPAPEGQKTMKDEVLYAVRECRKECREPILRVEEIDFRGVLARGRLSLECPATVGLHCRDVKMWSTWLWSDDRENERDGWARIVNANSRWNDDSLGGEEGVGDGSSPERMVGEASPEMGVRRLLRRLCEYGNAQKAGDAAASAVFWSPQERLQGFAGGGGEDSGGTMQYQGRVMSFQIREVRYSGEFAVLRILYDVAVGEETEMVKSVEETSYWVSEGAKWFRTKRFGSDATALISGMDVVGGECEGGLGKIYVRSGEM